MPNHVDLILCPQTEDGPARAIGAAHRRRANFINANFFKSLGPLARSSL
jgi:hypothetical protein